MAAAFRRNWCSFVFLILISGGVLATSSPTIQTLPIDSAQSHAEFQVKVLWLIGLHGQFGAVHGSVSVDRFHGTAKVDARINVNDLDMRSSNYANWARSSEFFDAQHYPQIHFVSESFPLIRMRRGGEVEGTLTIRGIARHVRFVLVAAACAQPLRGGCPVHAQGHIRRSDFGMHSRRGTLADKIGLQLSISVNPPAGVVP